MQVYEAAIARVKGLPVPEFEQGPITGPTDVDVEENLSTEVEGADGAGESGMSDVTNKDATTTNKQQEDAPC